MKLTKLRISLIVVAVLVVAVAAAAFYFYQHGSKEHYVPPAAKLISNEAQVIADLETLSKAIEAYYSINLKYPGKLEDLQPDFVDKLPVEAWTGKSYTYTTDGTSKYRVSVPDPQSFNLKEFALENGTIIKK